MDTFIQDSIVEQAERHGYKLIEANQNSLWFSIDGKENPSYRTTFDDFDLEAEPPDFIALSGDRRYLGAIGHGWKSGPLMMMRLTEMGLNYIAMTDDERQAFEDRIRRPLTPEESAGIDALIEEARSGVSTPASERAKENYATGMDQELRQRRNLRLLEKIPPHAPRN